MVGAKKAMKPTIDLKEKVMSIINSKTDEELKKEFEELEASMKQQDRDYNKQRLISWIASGALHVTIMLIMATFVYTQIKPEEIDLGPARISVIIPTPPPKDPPKDDPFKPEPLNISDIDHEVTADKTIVSDIDLVITPALGVDKKGNRLGRGGSYYDRFFANEKLRAVKCAFVFAEQVLDSIPAGDHDKQVDLLVTDNKVVYFNPDLSRREKGV